MPIDTWCQHCGTHLKVADQWEGQEVRCPRCDHVFPALARADATKRPAEEPVQAAEASQIDSTSKAADGANSDGVSRWLLRTPEGNLYGPADRDTLDQWVTEGRVSAGCQLSDSAGGSWESAVATYPMLAEDGNPFAPSSLRGLRNHQIAHRGPLILSLALLGCVVPFVSFGASFLGTQDLRHMQQGKMDAAGEGLTRAGQVIAMVASMVWIGIFALVLLALLIRMMSSV